MLGCSFGRRALMVEGVVQSVAPADAQGGYWEAMLPEQRPSSALLLGVGGGTVALLLIERFGPLQITGVDESEEILSLAEEAFGLTAAAVELVCDDAFAYVHQTERRFDFIAVDLYRANRLAPGVLALPFLRALAARLEPGGAVAFNLFDDAQLQERLLRLERVFEPLRAVEVGANTVVHGRPRRRRQR